MRTSDPYEGSRVAHSPRRSRGLGPYGDLRVDGKISLVGARGCKKFPRRDLTELKFPKRNNRDFGNITLKETQ